MSIAPSPTSSFDVLTGPMADQLLAAAVSVTTRAAGDASHGVLVVVVRPHGDDPQVVSGGGSGVLRAAVSVAVAAGNDRLWRDAPVGGTEEQAVRSLPEIVGAAADADGVRAVHVGAVGSDDRVDAVAMWFETWHGVASADERDDVLDQLATAARQEAERRAELAASGVQVVDDAVDVSGERTFDPNDPDLDPVTGVLCAERFEDRILDLEREEAVLLVIDLDGFATIGEEWGSDTSDRVLRIVADRLVESSRRDDLVARIGHDRFAILFGAMERSAAVTVAKRLLVAIAEPLGLDAGPASITGTVALSHQVGLVDVEEMVESATGALASGKRIGAGRLVLAA